MIICGCRTGYSNFSPERKGNLSVFLQRKGWCSKNVTTFIMNYFYRNECDEIYPCIRTISILNQIHQVAPTFQRHNLKSQKEVILGNENLKLFYLSINYSLLSDLSYLNPCKREVTVSVKAWIGFSCCGNAWVLEKDWVTAWIEEFSRLKKKFPRLCESWKEILWMLKFWAFA